MISQHFALWLHDHVGNTQRLSNPRRVGEIVLISQAVSGKDYCCPTSSRTLLDP
jgi:hypothetical protein